MAYDKITDKVLGIIDSEGFKEEGAYNLRYNGTALCHGDSEHVKIKKKPDVQGIDVFISKDAQGETIHIPVVVSQSGLNDKVYNEFFIEAGANVKIIAGCGLHNSGCDETRHDGIHTFHVGAGANVTYTEKHYGEGEGTGAKVLNPVTRIFLDEGAIFYLESTQIEGVDSTKRETEIHLGAGSKLFATEKLMTHDQQTAVSNVDVTLEGTGSSAQIISRSVAKGTSVQSFHPRAIGNAGCSAHIQCDSIIMEGARVISIPEIDANHIDAAIIHEAAIGRINSDQLMKLQTLGLSEEEAEGVIVEAFLN